jgi:hypothetical protein
MIVNSSTATRVTSSRNTLIKGSREIVFVTCEANVARSTASAWPAGTEHSRAISMSKDPARRISSFNNHGAVFSLSDLSEFEQTNSAKSLV